MSLMNFTSTPNGASEMAFGMGAFMGQMGGAAPSMPINATFANSGLAPFNGWGALPASLSNTATPFGMQSPMQTMLPFIAQPRLPFTGIQQQPFLGLGLLLAPFSPAQNRAFNSQAQTPFPVQMMPQASAWFAPQPHAWAGQNMQGVANFPWGNFAPQMGAPWQGMPFKGYMPNPMMPKQCSVCTQKARQFQAQKAPVNPLTRQPQAAANCSTGCAPAAPAVPSVPAKPPAAAPAAASPAAASPAAASPAAASPAAASPAKAPATPAIAPVAPSAIKGGRRISDKTLDRIKKWEGFSLKPYNCPANVPTIGYGHAMSKAEQAKYAGGITQEQATALLRQDLQKAESAVQRMVKVPLTQGQFDALVSFTYNCGAGALQKSNSLKFVNQGNFAAVAPEFTKWNKGAGQVLQGLVSRRATEIQIFQS
jgi:lysozyme